MAVLEGERGRFIAQVPSPHYLRVSTEVGQQFMAHCTSVGRALLSLLPDEQACELLQRTAPHQRTSDPLASVDARLNELAAGRERGYFLDQGEQEPGATSIAIAIVGLPLPVAVSISGPSFRLDCQTAPAVGRRMRAQVDDAAWRTTGRCLGTPASRP
jgi:IclR family acetate operon transcriptional repressor